MTEHPVISHCAPKPLESMSSPYHQALYLHSLIKAADNLVDHLNALSYMGGPSAVELGLPGLLTVIEERADILSQTLEDMDEEGWALAMEAIEADRAASMEKARAAMPPGA